MMIEHDLRSGGIAFSSKRVETEATFRAALGEFQPDIILSDNELPTFSGTAGLTLARELCPKVPVIFISGTIGEERAVELVKLGATDYLLKGHHSRLVPAVQRALREVKERAENVAALETQIAKRERADEGMRESRAQFEGVIDSAMDGIISINEVQRVVLFNAAAERMFGWTGVEAIGQPLKRFIPARLPVFSQLGLTGQTEQRLDSLIGRRANDQEFPIEASISQTRAGGAKLITVILRDVTQRHKADSALRESEERFRQLAENISEVFWMKTATENQLLYVSPAYEAIWGRTCQSLYASPKSWFEAIHPDDRDRVLQATRMRQAGGIYEEEYRIMRPDRTSRWIQDRAFPVRDANGQLDRMVGLARDVTANKEAEVELQRREAHFRSLIESSSDLIVVLNPEGLIRFQSPFSGAGAGLSSEGTFGSQRLRVGPSGG